MKNFYSPFLVCLLFLLSTAAFAQSSQKTKGDRYFDKHDYGRAIEYYQMAWDENPLDASVSRKIAQCYKKLSMPDMTAEWYEKTLALDQSNPEDMVSLASALKRMERYDEALLWFKKYSRVNPIDTRPQRHLAYRKFFEKLKEDSMVYNLHRLSINNDRSVLGISKYRDGKFLVSSGGFADNEEDLDVLPYLDIYECSIDAEKELFEPKILEGEVNSRYHDGPACYDPTTNSIYITRNNMEKGKPVRDATGSVNLKIYRATEVDGEFEIDREFEHNSDDYSNGHPTVTKDGKTLIFVSNRPGGFGGTDLYICQQNGEGWSEPKNMGPVINSEGDEMFPSVNDEGLLFYASDGLVGLGGLDIFFTEKKSEGWSEPENMGYPVNSHVDDFSLIFDEGTGFGYFTSSRDGGLGGDDLFYFEKADLTEKKFAVMLASTTEELDLEGGTLIIRDLNTGREERIPYDGREKVEFLAKPNELIEVSFEKDGIFVFEPILFDAPVETEIEDPYVNVGHFIYSETIQEAEALAHELDAKDWKVRIFEHTEFEDEQVLDDELAMVPFLIPSNVVYNEKNWTETWGEEELEAALANIGMIFSEDFNRNSILRDLALDNIYYGYNSADLSSKSKEILNQLKILMKDHPEYKLQVVAHTDERGSEEYNILLSKKRALNAYHYLLSKGIPKDRLQMFYFGEEKLLDTEGVASLSEEEMHQLNRRAEFNIVMNENEHSAMDSE